MSFLDEKPPSDKSNDEDLPSLQSIIKRLEENEIKIPTKETLTNSEIPISMRDVTKVMSNDVADAEKLIEENRLLYDDLLWSQNQLSLMKSEKSSLNSSKLPLYNDYMRMQSPVNSSYNNENVRIQSPVSSFLSVENYILQINQLKQKIEDDHSNYKRKLHAYQEGQEKQSELIQKLQSKVQQYKMRNNELEMIANDKSNELEELRDKLQVTIASAKEYEKRLMEFDEDRSNEMENYAVQLEEEKQRNVNLQHANNMLHEQLEQATSANSHLSLETQKLSIELTKSCDELKHRDSEEENYFTEEHRKLVNLWNSIDSFRSAFNIVKLETQKDLLQVKAEFSKSARTIQAASMELEKTQRGLSTVNQNTLLEEQAQREKVESQLREKIRELIDLQATLNKMKDHYEIRLDEITNSLTESKARVDEQQKTIGLYKNKLKQLGIEYSETTENWKNDSQVNIEAMREEIEVLQSTLYELANCILEDADSTSSSLDYLLSKVEAEIDTDNDIDPSSKVKDIVQSSSPLIHVKLRSKSPVRARSPAYIQSLVAGSQSAMKKRQLQLQEQKRQLDIAVMDKQSFKRQFDISSSKLQQLNTAYDELKTDHLSLQSKYNKSNEDCNKYRNQLQIIEKEKQSFENMKNHLQNKVEEYEHKVNQLENQISYLKNNHENESEKKDSIMNEVSRLSNESQQLQKVIADLECKQSMLKEECVDLKEKLNRASLEKDVFLQENTHLQELLKSAQDERDDLENDVNKLKMDEVQLKDALVKLQTLNEALGEDKLNLGKIVLQVEAERDQIYKEKENLESEKLGLKEELLRIDKEKASLESERKGILEAINLNDATIEKLEEQLQEACFSKNKMNDTLNNVVREKEVSQYELVSLRLEVERLQNSLNRLLKEKEELTKENSLISVKLSGNLKEIQALTESNALLKSEKETLESYLYELQHLVGKLEVRKEQLETSNHEVHLAKDTIAVELAHLKKENEIQTAKLNKENELLQQKLSLLERERDLSLSRLKEQHEDQIHQLAMDKDKMLTAKKEEHLIVINELKEEMEDYQIKAERDRLALINEVASIQRERDDLLLQAEAEKQAHLRAADSEKSLLVEKITKLKDDLDSANEELEILKRDLEERAAREKDLLNDSAHEIEKCKENLEETVNLYEAKLKDLVDSHDKLLKNKEELYGELSNAKFQLKILNENHEAAQKECKELTNKVIDLNGKLDDASKHTLELKRSLKDAEVEKMLVLSGAEELREAFKQVESEKMTYKKNYEDSKKLASILDDTNVMQTRETDDLRHMISELETARQETRKEVQQLQNRVRLLDTECVKCKKDLNIAKDQLNKTNSLLEEERLDLINTKNKLRECETSKDAIKAEMQALATKAREHNDEFGLREKDLLMALEDARQTEVKVYDKMRQLENLLDVSNQEKSDLKLKLSSVEGRNLGLEDQLTKLEALKNDLDSKLSNVYSALRRTLGIKPNQSINSTPSPQPNVTPKRRAPYARNRVYLQSSHDQSSEFDETPPSKNVSFDTSNEMDPEYVRNSLREFAQKFKDLEHERDEALINIGGLQRQLENLEMDRLDYENRLSVLQKSLQDTAEDKRGADGRLSSAQTALLLQEETIRRLERERKTAEEKFQILESTVAQLETEKRTLKEKYMKAHKHKLKYEQEAEAMRSQIDGAESRITRTDLKKKSLEGDIDRLRSQLHDAENEKHATKQRLEILQRTCKDLELKSSSLQLTVDRLNMSLSKSTDQEHLLQSKVTELSAIISEKQSVVVSLQDKLQQTERIIVSNEQEKQAAFEKVENLKKQLLENKKLNDLQNDKILNLRNEIANLESTRINLESELRQVQTLLQKNKVGDEELLNKLEKFKEEKKNLQERLAQQQRLLAQGEQEKRDIEKNSVKVEKEKRALKATVEQLEKEKFLIDEELIQLKNDQTESDKIRSNYEQTINSLRIQLSQLQETLEEKELQHNKKLASMSARHRDDLMKEIERMKSSQQSLDRTYDARERAHKQRIRGLEDQINTLKDQFAKEIQQKQSFINRTTQKNEEIQEIRQKINSSINEVARNADPRILDRESQKLDTTYDNYNDFSAVLTASTPYSNRMKVSPFIIDKYSSMTPTTDPGLMSSRIDLPITTEARNLSNTTFVSPIRKNLGKK
ncbi:rootletin [Hydra vulgaris]|uniref:rootletin n=1 Tax=Hydra vulgaris TaxID=6087 RepID=UPI001F5F015D|nr:rootletin [Hydra vulgaris]